MQGDERGVKVLASFIKLIGGEIIGEDQEERQR